MIKHIRIDNRLIHGQVATTWCKDYAIESAIIVDNDVANDERIGGFGSTSNK